MEGRTSSRGSQRWRAGAGSGRQGAHLGAASGGGQGHIWKQLSVENRTSSTGNQLQKAAVHLGAAGSAGQGHIWKQLAARDRLSLSAPAVGRVQGGRLWGRSVFQGNVAGSLAWGYGRRRGTGAGRSQHSTWGVGEGGSSVR